MAMSKKKAWLLTIVLMTALLPAFPAWAEAEKPAEWTVMFYLCGSDLESRHGYATQNLEQIERCMSYGHVWNMLRGLFPSEGEVWPASVNVVIETGGSKRWHAQELGMDVATDRLQRWRYAPYAGNGSDGSSAFALEADIPLASMADPETLADFIRWGAENYPAEKYALVLWDHGGGSKTGIFIDELFDGDMLYLDELHDALAGGGVNFEAVVFDACLMANIETAHAIKDNARWMIASEEVVAGKGTAIGDWLQQLFYAPQWDGERLGRWICDMTETKYASDGNDQARDILTWSVIDLSKIEMLATQFDNFFESVGRCYATDPAMMVYNAYFLTEAFEFGFGEDNMIDLSELFYHPFIIGSLELDVYYDVLDALAEAVVYNARGTSRSGTGGLSFCYAADFTRAEMDVYARNCPFPHYLAFLDAIMPTWTAPEWVYQAVDRLPDMQDIEDYRLRVNKWIGDDNIPGYTITEGLANVRGGFVDLYRLDEETSLALRLGCVPAVEIDGTDASELSCTFDRFTGWLCVEGVYCDSEMVRENEARALYNIPVQIGSTNWLLRCGFDVDKYDGDWMTYSLLEGYNADSGVFDRNVASLSQLAGREYRLLYPVDGTVRSGRTLYETSAPMTMYRALQIKPRPLPAGIYYLDYWVKDMFMRRLPVGRAEVYWDGENVSMLSGDSWQGEMTLTVLED